MLAKLKSFFSKVNAKIKAFLSDDKKLNISVPLIAVFLGFMVGVLIMIVTGRDPIDIFRGLIRATAGIDTTRFGDR